LILLLSKERKKTVLVSSHLLSEIEQVADSMLIINKGKKIVEGKVNELLNPNHVRLEITVDDDLGAKQLIGNSVWSKGLKHAPYGKLIVETEAKAVGQLNKLLVENNINVTSLRSMNSLEAYFLSLTAGNEV
jgi:ABC-type multidrug transport system ATPase subunit